ncbi:hypothetical protein AKJ39_03060 [candidate division MSBL1 archaeon SCGC-AAA259J03]|uniref:Uncharacterized protein n=1 Tax=candidate division MSBL1 archaeon SCGC-AAA259J03 TaxID=1698269 RepID=A0A656YXR7_9EURY|nr:hypothetical protein AKJ39_03060 [candidate division MSBL1 archaeon SCGC-AAA259J03]
MKDWFQEKENFDGQELGAYLDLVRNHHPKIPTETREKIDDVIRLFIEMEDEENRSRIRLKESILRITYTIAKLNMREVRPRDAARAVKLISPEIWKKIEERTGYKISKDEDPMVGDQTGLTNERISIENRPLPHDLIDPSTSSESVIIPEPLINSMEMRAGSAFRPGDKDVETGYALSGSEPNSVDTLHGLTSGDVIKFVSPDLIRYSPGGRHTKNSIIRKIFTTAYPINSIGRAHTSFKG